MKLKITAALLACFMLLASLSSCNQDKENNGDDTSSGGNIPILTTPGDTSSTPAPEETDDPAITTTDPAVTDTSATTTTSQPPVTTPEQTDTTTEPPAVTTEPPAEEITFTACDETVYVTASALNLRTSPAMGDNIYNQVTEGQALRRVGYHETWSKVILEDKEYYVSTKYLSTEDPNAEVVFTTRYETVYVTASSLYVREAPSSSGKIYDTVTNGTEVIRIGYNETWSKIMYDGQILYAGSKYLSTENPNSLTTATTETSAQ